MPRLLLVLVLLAACGPQDAVIERAHDGDGEVQEDLTSAGLLGSPIRVATANGRIYAWSSTNPVKQRRGFSADLTSVARYAMNRGPCAGLAPGTCAFDAVASPDGLQEQVFARGQRWVYTAGILTGGPRDLTTIARYGTNGPCAGKPPLGCRVDAVSWADAATEVVIAEGRIWRFNQGALVAGFPRDLTAIARFSAGPCAGRAALACRFDTYDVTGTIETVTTDGKIWKFDAGVLKPNFPRELKSDPIYSTAGGPCEGVTGQCRLATSEVYTPPNPNLKYFGAYNNADTVARASGSLSFGNLLWYYVYYPEGKANPKDPDVVNAPMWRLLRANPHARFGLPMGDPRLALDVLKTHYQRSIARIPADLKSRLVFVQVVDEPYLSGFSSSQHTKFEAINKYIHELAPGAATYVNFSYLEVDAGVHIPAGTDWIGFDCYRWLGCADVSDVDRYLRAVETAIGNAGLTNAGIVMIPQAHTHKNQSSEVQPAVDYMFDYLKLSTSHARVVAVLPFSAGDYQGVFGYENGSPASNLLKQNGVVPVGRQFAP